MVDENISSVRDKKNKNTVLFIIEIIAFAVFVSALMNLINYIFNNTDLHKAVSIAQTDCMLVYPDYKMSHDYILGSEEDKEKLDMAITEKFDVLSNNYSVENYGEIGSSENVMWAMCVNNNKLYVAERHGKNYNYIWCMDFNGKHEENIVAVLDSKYDIHQIVADEDDNIYIFMNDKKDENYKDLSNYYLAKYKMGEEIFFKDISHDVIFDKGDSAEIYKMSYHEYYHGYGYDSECIRTNYDIYSAYYKDNYIYVANNCGIAKYNTYGELKNWESNYDKSLTHVGIITDRKDDKYIISSSNVYSEYCLVDKIEKINKNMKTTDYINMLHYKYKYDNLNCNSVNMNVATAGKYYDLLTRNKNSLYGCDFKKQTVRKILNFVNCGIDGKDVIYTAELSDGRIVVITRTNSCYEVYLLTRDFENNTDKRKIITLGTNFFDDTLIKKIIAYNKAYKDYRIVAGYFDEFDGYEKRSDFDLFAIEGYSKMCKEYVEQGLIEDLTPYYEQSSKATLDNFFKPVVDNHTYNGVLVGIPGKITIYENLPALFDFTNTTIGNLEAYIKNNPQLIELLNNEGILDSSDENDLDQLFDNIKQLNMQYNSMDFAGKIIFDASQTFCISSGSEYKDAAWRFINLLWMHQPGDSYDYSFGVKAENTGMHVKFQCEDPDCKFHSGDYIEYTEQMIVMECLMSSLYDCLYLLNTEDVTSVLERYDNYEKYYLENYYLTGYK